MFHFSRRYALLRTAELITSFGTHLDKNQSLFLSGDDVNLTTGTAVIGLYDMIAVLLKEITGYYLTKHTGFSSLHIISPIISLTGLKDRR